MGRDNLFAVLSQECMNRLKTIIFSPCGGHTVKKALFVGSNRKFEISSPIPDHSHRSCWKSSEINEDSIKCMGLSECSWAYCLRLVENEIIISIAR